MKRAERKAKRQLEARERQALYNALTPEERIAKDAANKTKLAKS